jgi:hypothetical protein
MKSRTHGIDWPCLVSSEAHGEVCLYTASALERALKESVAYLLIGPSRLYRPHFQTHGSQFQPGYRSQKNIQSP